MKQIAVRGINILNPVEVDREYYIIDKFFSLVLIQCFLH